MRYRWLWFAGISLGGEEWMTADWPGGGGDEKVSNIIFYNILLTYLMHTSGLITH